MWQVLKFLAVLISLLGLLAWGAFRLVSHTTRVWFEEDINLRAELAVESAGNMLAAQWHEESAVRAILTEITHDERILAAAACDPDAVTRAQTPGFPPVLTCERLARRLRPDSNAMAGQARGTAHKISRGNVFVTPVPLKDDDQTLGFVVLVHDLAFVQRREARTQELILAAFGLLAFMACMATLVASGLFRRRWAQDLRQFLRRSGERRREMQPLPSDWRAMSDRMFAERRSDAETGSWTPQRLKSTLARYLQGERVVVLANREPYIHNFADDGNIKIMHPASGLVSALEPVMEACSGVWIAHGSGSADRATVDAHDRILVPPDVESYQLRRVWLSADEEKGYYFGFANEGLWPLCHIAHTRPTFRSEDWQQYRIINERFALAVLSEVEQDDPIVLVQDYHFALAPAMIRQRLPRATVITFWHIPWPNAERFGICPWRDEILQGLLGSSVVGFQTRLHCNNFIESVDRYLETRIDREQFAITQMERMTLVRDYPISIEWPSRWARAAPPVAECRASVLAELNLPPDTLLGVGVDRLDYTKGIEERLWAVERLLEKVPDFIGRFVFVQLAAPSRTLIERYQTLNDDLEKTAARINERFGDSTYQPVVLFRSHHEAATVFRYYRAANFCCVSSLHDGMNLVAKEFVAARDDEQGALVLSYFAGASRELAEALIVNPYDRDEMSRAYETALTMSPQEQRERMRAMRAHLAEFNVYRWAGRMLIDATMLRRKERLSGRWAHDWQEAEALSLG